MIFLHVFFVVIEYSLACLCVGELILRALIKVDRKNITLSEERGQKNRERRIPRSDTKRTPELNLRHFPEIHPISAGAELATAYLLGQGILANIWLLIAVRGWFAPMVVKVTVILLAIGCLTLTHKQLHNFFRQLISIFNEVKVKTWGWKLIVILTCLLCLAWITSLGRSPRGDGSAFYLAIAKVTADSQRLAPLPGFEDFTSIGLQGEMHYAALISLGSPGAVQIFSWLTLLAGALMLLAIAGKLGVNRGGQWLVLAMLFTSSAVIEISGSGKTDLFATALGFAAYYWAIRIREPNRYSTYWLTGLFAGLTLVAKVSYVLTFIPSIAIIIFWSFYSRSRAKGEQLFGLKETTALCFVIFAGVLIAAIPHLIKNTALFDNPLAPLGTGTTGFHDQTWYGPETTRRILYTIPLSLTFGDHWAQLGNLSPLILAFSPLALFLPRPRRLLNSPLFMMTISAVIGMAVWFILRPSVLAPRYFMACLLLLAIPVAKSTELVVSNNPGSGALNYMIFLATILMIISSSLYYLDKVFYPKQTYSYLMGRLSECERDPENCGIMTTINETAGPGERLFTNTFLRYWFRSDLIQCALTTDEMNAYKRLETPEQRWAFIYGRGFRYIPILKYSFPSETFNSKDLEHIPEWLSVTSIEDGKNTLLLLDSLDPSHKPGVGCRQIAPPAWDLFDLRGP